MCLTGTASSSTSSLSQLGSLGTILSKQDEILKPVNQDFQDVTLAIEDTHTVAAFSAAAGAAVKDTLTAAALESVALGADGEPYPLP